MKCLSASVGEKMSDVKLINPFRLAAFLSRQLSQVRAGGWPIVRRKLNIILSMIVRLPLLVVEFPVSLMIVLLMRLIRPFCLVRLNRIIGWRIGHFAANLELYLCEREVGINTPSGRHLDVWYHLCDVCNKQLDTMWRRRLHIGPGRLLRLADRINSLLPGGTVHKIGDNTCFDRDVHNLVDRFSPHLTFLDKEEAWGKSGLRALGIPEGAPFVCLIVRDSSYLHNQSAHIDWSYHNYRDCNIQNYVLAAQKLVERGYYVVRMGAVVEAEMDVDDPMIIDYATNGMRSDFMDIYLGAKCAFCINGNSGFEALPYVFLRPMVYVDYVPLGIMRTDSQRLIATIKKHWLRNEGRFMTFQEIVESGADYFFHSNNFEEIGIDLLESTPKEIAAVVLEMEERLKGTWQITKEDEELQKKFWEFFPKTPYHGEIRSRIGAEFLRLHKDFLA